MPGSSLVEELTSAVVETQRLLAKIVANPSSAHSNQPVCDDNAILAADLRSVRELFRPPLTDDVFAGPPPGFPLQSLQQPSHLGSTVTLQRVAAVPHTQIVVPTTAPIIAPLQNVQTLPHIQFTAPTLSPTTSPLQRVSHGKRSRQSKQSMPQVTPTSTQPAIVIPNQPIRPPDKVRKHHYFDLSQQEIHKVDKLKVRRIGMQFLDNTDPNDTATGIIVAIVRHKKSHKLAYRCWDDHTIHATAPKDEASFDYMDVNYATQNCKWSKVVKAAFLAVMPPSRKSVKKARQRARYIPWYHRLYVPANVSTPDPHRKFHACTALDLNADGTRLTSTSALKGPDKLIWEKANGEEIIRLI